MKSRQKTYKRTITSLKIIGFVLFVIILTIISSHGVLGNEYKMKMFIKSFGALAPIIFIIIQILLITIPFLVPWGFNIGIGLMMFGTWHGLFLSTIGIIIGSVINFVLAKKFGWRFIEKFFDLETRLQVEETLKIDRRKLESTKLFIFLKNYLSSQKYNKLVNYLLRDDRFYHRAIVFTSFIPFFPVDTFSYIYGLTNVKVKEFFKLMVVIKPIHLLIYGFMARYLVVTIIDIWPSLF